MKIASLTALTQDSNRLFILPQRLFATDLNHFLIPPIVLFLHMGTTLDEYFNQLELVAFFAGFPLVFIIVMVFAGKAEKPAALFSILKRLLPFSYTLTGSFYLAFLLREQYTQYNLHHTLAGFALPWLTLWALLSLLMFIQPFRSKIYLCFLHSLVFLFLLLKDFFLHASGQLDQHMLRTNMKLYSDSLILHATCLLITFLLYILFKNYRAMVAKKIADRSENQPPFFS